MLFCLASHTGADHVGNAAAGLAAASLVFRLPGASQDTPYADMLLKRAKQLYRLATGLQDIWYPPAGDQVSQHSQSNSIRLVESEAEG